MKMFIQDEKNNDIRDWEYSFRFAEVSCLVGCRGDIFGLGLGLPGLADQIMTIAHDRYNLRDY